MPRFVIHEHWASHHHFDLRMQRNGHLEDWAVPKGIPKESGKKVLAIKQPSHPMKWLTFEGEIKDGYGAGKLKIWDSGTFTPIKWERDRIVVQFNGRKIKGIYVLFKFDKEKNSWWLFKTKKSLEDYEKGSK